jgi:hypothetical protein
MFGCLTFLKRKRSVNNCLNYHLHWMLMNMIEAHNIALHFVLCKNASIILHSTPLYPLQKDEQLYNIAHEHQHGIDAHEHDRSS